MDFDIRLKSVRSKIVRLHYHSYTGSFTLTYPKGFSKIQRDKYLKEWESWMKDCLKKQPPPVFRDGDTVSLFGDEWRVYFLQPDKKTGRAELSEGKLLLYGSFPEGEREIRERAEILLEKQLYLRARRWMEYYGHLMQLPEVSLFIRVMRSRWGSCFPGKRKIHLSRYLMYKDEKFLQEVVLHEMIHFIHPNHQKGFKEALKRYKINQQEKN